MMRLFVRTFLIALLVGTAVVAVFALAAQADNGPNTIIGTRHSERLVGGNGPDLVKAKGGNDIVSGNHGPDVLKGGPGDDVFWPGKSIDTVHCGSGVDTVHQRAHPLEHDTIGADCERVVS